MEGPASKMLNDILPILWIVIPIGLARFLFKKRPVPIIVAAGIGIVCYLIFK